MIPFEEDVTKYIKDKEKDSYKSLYLYNESQKREFEAKNSAEGISDVVGNKLCIDFDDKANPEQARLDALSMGDKLVAAGFDAESIQIFFSGQKGFGLEIELTEYLTPQQLKDIAFHFGNDYKTFDRKIYDHVRVIRIPNTKHQVTKLYKIALEYDELNNMTIPEIQELAKFTRPVPPVKKCKLPASLKTVKPEPIKIQNIKMLDINDIDWSKKPKDMSNCKYAIQNGFFEEGGRHYSFLALASYYKNKGFTRDLTMKLLEGVADQQAEYSGNRRYSDTELEKTVMNSVFSDGWKGGEYSCKNKDNFLYEYCLSFGHKSCQNKLDDEEPHTILSITHPFKDYVVNIDKNTIKTGIKTIDDNLFLSTGINLGILGSSGSGKTSLALNILNNTSKQGVKSVFASLDMHHNRVFEKIMYKVTGMGRKQLYKTFQDNKEGPLLDMVKKEFGNVFFFCRSAPTVKDLRDYIIKCNEKGGEKIKVVLIDYFERLTSEVSDETASSKKVAGELQDLVNDLGICLITLVQPTKGSLNGGIDVPVRDFTAIKGSSFIYQSFRAILSIWRPFHNFKTADQDKYMKMAVLKNDLGELNEFTFAWDGKRGMISELDPFEIEEVERLINEKDREKEEERKGSWT